MKQQQKLIIAVLSMTHLVEINITSNNRMEFTGGVEGMFLKDALTALGIEYEVVYPPDRQQGRMKRNGSWTGIIGMTMRGDSDMGCCELAMTEQKRKAVEFSTPYAYEHFTFVIKKPEKVHLQNGYLYPFQRSVWVCYIAMLIAMSSVLWIALERKYSLGRIVFGLFGIALKQPFVVSANQWMEKSLLAILCVCSLVMTSAYSGLLLSYLTVSSQGETIENFRQLSAAVEKGTHKCYEVGDILAVPFLLDSNEEHLQLLGKAISRNKWRLDTTDEDAINDFGPNTAIITGSYLINIVTQGTPMQRSKYIISKDVIGTALVSIALNRNFCCRKRLDDIIMRFGRAGMTQNYVRETAFKRYLSTSKTQEKMETNHKISLDDITGAFLVLGVGYALSFTTLLTEILISKYNLNHLRL